MCHPGALRLLVCICLFGLLSMTCSACSEPTPQPLRVGLLVWVGYSPFYVAAERKLNKPASAELTTFSARADLDRAFHGGKLDAATTTLFGAIRLADQGVDLKIVMAIDSSRGADGIVARPGIASVRELKGKRVATDIGSISHFLLLRALELSGMSTSDVEIVNVTLEQASIELKQGKVDAAVTWEPFLSKAVGQGATKIFTSAELPDEILDVLVVPGESAERRRDALAGLMRGWDRAIGLWKTQPAEVLGVMARTQGMGVEALTGSLTGLDLLDLARNQQLFDRAAKGQSIWKAYEVTARFMTEAKLLKQAAPPAEALLDARILVEAAGR